MSRLPPPARERRESMDRRRVYRAEGRGKRARDRRDRNRKKLDPVAAGRTLLVLLLIGQCLRVAFTSPRLRLESVVLAGADSLTPEEVVRLGAIPLGTNIFRVNLVRVSRKLAETPSIREAIVSRELPGTLRIELVERVPALQILSPRAGQVAVLHADESGVVFEPAEAPTRRLPILELPLAEMPRPGEKLDAELLTGVWECMRLAREARLDLRKLRVDGAGELWLNIETYPTSRSSGGSLPVRVGRTTELPKKFQDIRQVLLGWPDIVATAEHLDVVSAGSPSYRHLPESRTTR